VVEVTQRRARGRPRKEDAPEPELILEAALRSFARLGYGGVTLRGIAREADVDSSLIARRYDGKFGLWRAVVDHVSAQLAQIDKDATPADTARNRLDRMIARFVSLSLAMPDFGRFFIDEIAQPGERRNYIVSRIWEVHRAAMLPVTEAAASEQLIPDGCSPHIYVAMLVGAVAMPLMMRSVALPDLDATGGHTAFLTNVMVLFAPFAPSGTEITIRSTDERA
jgi:TetR/AcrR family transcriptional regulator